jgi:hypothetical protein
VAEPRDLRSLVGDDLGEEELDRLQRVHELLLEAGPPPELSPALTQAPPVGREARRERFSWYGNPRLGAAIALAAGVAALFFGIGFLAGHGSSGFDAKRTVSMFGTAAAPKASAAIEVGSADDAGNLPMLVHVQGLPKVARGYYELFLTVKGKPRITCGTFAGGQNVSFRLSIPFQLKRYDGWVVTREHFRAKQHPGPVVLTTFV